jgi:hypothetical protein
VITLLVLSFEEPWRQLLNAEWKQPELTIAVVIGVPALSLAMVHQSHGRLAPLAVLVLCFVVSQLAAVYVNFTGLDYLSIYFQICENIVLIAFGIWLIIRGIRDGLTHYFYLGVLTILMAGLLRYIDLVGDYVGASILFMIFAVLLLVSARYWKRHRNLNPGSSAHG